MFCMWGRERVGFLLFAYGRGHNIDWVIISSTLFVCNIQSLKKKNNNNIFMPRISKIICLNANKEEHYGRKVCFSVSIFICKSHYFSCFLLSWASIQCRLVCVWPSQKLYQWCFCFGSHFINFINLFTLIFQWFSEKRMQRA